MTKRKGKYLKTLISACTVLLSTFFIQANNLVNDDFKQKAKQLQIAIYPSAYPDASPYQHQPGISQPPVLSATISGTTTVCQNDTEPQVTFTGTAGTAPYTFTYNINGGTNQTIGTAGGDSIVSVNVPTHIDGTFSYNLVSVKDHTGDVQSITSSTTVHVDPLPIATAGGSQTICSNGNATVSGAYAANGNIHWIHDGAGSITGETSLSPTYTPTVADAGKTISLSLTVSSNNACSPRSSHATYTVHVDLLPIATAGGSQTICSNGNATVSGAYAANGNIHWTHNGAGSITG